MANVQINDLASVTPADDTSLIVQTAAGTTGKASPSAVCGAGAIYGVLYYSGAGSVITLTVQSTWYGFTAAVAGEAQDVTIDAADATADHLTVATNGTYRISLTACYSTSGLGTYELSAHIDGAECATGCATRRYLSAGDVGSVAAHALVALTAGQEISVRARCTTSAGKTLTVERLALSIERLGA